MLEVGILGTLEPYDDEEHGSSLEFGHDVGRYRLTLELPPTEDNTAAWTYLIQVINAHLRLCKTEFSMPSYSTREDALCQATRDLREIRKVLLFNNSGNPAKLIYFMIGVAAGTMYADKERQHVSLAESNLFQINTVQKGITIQPDRLIKPLQLTTVVEKGASPLIREMHIIRISGLLQSAASKITILYVSARPHEKSVVKANEELKALEDAVSASKNSGVFSVENQAYCQRADFHAAVLKYKPRIIHFAGHGFDEGILLENEDSKADVLPPENLEDLLKIAKSEGLELIVLNACETQAQSFVISRHVRYVISMNGLVGEKNAISFTSTFYRIYGDRGSVEAAFNAAKSRLMMFSLKKGQIPTLVDNEQKGKVSISGQSVAAEEARPSREDIARLAGEDTKDSEESEPETPTRGGQDSKQKPSVQGSRNQTTKSQAQQKPGAAATPAAGQPKSNDKDLAIRSANSSGKAAEPHRGRDESERPAAEENKAEFDVGKIKALYDNKDFMRLVACLREQPNAFPQVFEQVLGRNRELAAELGSYEFELVRILLSANSFAHLLQKLGIQTQAAVRPDRSEPRGVMRSPPPNNSFFPSHAFMDDPFFASFFGPGIFGNMPRAGTAANPFSDLMCLRCKQPFPPAGGYLCKICVGGKCTICADCVGSNLGCNSHEHTLFQIERVIRR